MPSLDTGLSDRQCALAAKQLRKAIATLNASRHIRKLHVGTLLDCVLTLCSYTCLKYISCMLDEGRLIAKHYPYIEEARGNLHR